MLGCESLLYKQWRHFGQRRETSAEAATEAEPEPEAETKAEAEAEHPQQRRAR